MNFFISIGILLLGILGIIMAYVSIILLALILFFPYLIREYKHALKVSVICCVIFSILTTLGLLLVE